MLALNCCGWSVGDRVRVAGCDAIAHGEVVPAGEIAARRRQDDVDGGGDGGEAGERARIGGERRLVAKALRCQEAIKQYETPCGEEEARRAAAAAAGKQRRQQQQQLAAKARGMLP